MCILIFVHVTETKKKRQKEPRILLLDKTVLSYIENESQHRDEIVERKKKQTKPIRIKQKNWTKADRTNSSRRK